ncbi:MAG TPA: carbamoyltransferase N-terminal domain-containing protein, partial [Burkholderiales bacterium]|nr:carbamoyltransferase N-terminal domain-containing protein [Burkholderiales bacterium]
MFLVNEITHRMLVRYHPRIGHLYVPRLQARLPNETGGYLVRTNGLGFRSDFEYADERRTRPRILMFGDSYTAGDQCANSDRYSDQLAAMLGAEVYNYGVSGSGTDQHLLIYREFARQVEADLIVICVQIDSMRRIQLSHRESIDRVTKQRVLVPKPYFTLGEDGRLKLHQVPVPRERPSVGSLTPATGDSQNGWKERLLDWYRNDPRLAEMRNWVRRDLPRAKAEFFRLSGVQPYPEFRSRASAGWRLMATILRQFVEEVRPRPVLIVPVPSYEFYLHGMKPIYQPLFEDLEDPARGVSVADVSRPLVALPYETRQKLTFRNGGHFTPFANRLVARHIADCIRRHRLLPGAVAATKGGPPGTGLAAAVATPADRSAAAASRYVLGISCFYHNSAASLVKDSEIVAAAEEERFTRVKNDRRFPHQAINYCLEQGGIGPAQLAAVVYYDNTPLTFERILHSQYAAGERAAAMWKRVLPSWLRYKLHLPRLIREYLHYDGLILQDMHHRSHAASAFYPSPFERAAILTIDGVGEWATASLGRGEGERVELIKEMRFPHSLGLLYSAFTQFTGFKVNSGEYKMMGLAPYGRPRYVREILDNLVDVKGDGSLELNLDYFGFLESFSMTNQRFAELFGGPARAPESRITRREMDLARSIQVVTEEVMLRMARTAHRLTGETKLCLAGGVALNCVANGRLLREGPFDDLWIQPAAGDSGGALGAALDVYHTYFGGPRPLERNARPRQGGSYWGPEFSDEEIEAYLDTNGYPYRRLSDNERTDYLADRLVEGKVVGHFSGRLEYGPRALGARSILGDARNRDMQAELNLKIKYRESFRPFAPSVLAEDVAEYFELDRESPYMLLVAPVREERRKPLEPADEDQEDLLPIVRQARSDVPAVTHVDYSARIQTVCRADHPVYYGLIRRFKEKTGCGVIVNTSFNVR